MAHLATNSHPAAHTRLLLAGRAFPHWRLVRSVARTHAPRSCRHWRFRPPQHPPAFFEMRQSRVQSIPVLLTTSAGCAAAACSLVYLPSLLVLT
ncbi:uncharacterized protein TRAVEDRAFT_54629 [Trametes versicolor FP-101664 SS1]|uniref:Uncharacterized protein n=1 Tax=Trametes versicolor (strain FP-101664) TaxID=717944 RepID=R7S6Z4_TRAVS|nr:uncharacterized protein TRAVEDRAFT_54629 [Trametes versicolor FP-101664 SS1]EIW51365.1 hypothetical protein TRAVEDRAFT_54629 [Trametes versicolor FP-101664 SS1]